jgi:hypothetical protein
MAMGWLSVLKLVPWGDVIENAPKVAQGAKKLWNSVGKKPRLSTLDPVAHAASGGLQGQEAVIAALQSQVSELQVATADLHQQMLESSALIQSLADQNTQLVRRVDVHHKQLLALGALTLVLGLACVVQYFR